MKLFIKGAIFVIVAIASIGSAWLYINRYKPNTKAAEAVAEIAFTNQKIAALSGQDIKIGVTVSTGTLPMSGIDIAFETTGDTLDFQSFQLPVGFDEQVFIDNNTIAPQTGGTKRMKRLVFVSKKSAAQLPKSALIMLYFKVVNKSASSYITTLKVDVKNSMVTGPDIPGNVFTLSAHPNPPVVVVDSTPLTPTPVPDCRATQAQEVTCDSKCGQNVILRWKDAPDEDGYKIYKDNQTIPLAIVGKNQSAYTYSWCGDLNEHSYKVISYNSCGSRSTSMPTISCACKKCSGTVSTPTPATVQPVNTADIIFKLNFSDVAPTVQTVRNVRVDVMNGSTLACPACSQIVNFQRVGNYFVSPQLSFRLEQTMPYTVVVKQAVTTGHSYKFVYLQKNRLLNCSIGFDSACGQLLSEIDSRAMLSGDIDGFNAQSEGYNIIDKTDLDRVNAAVNAKTDQGDMNFDGVSNAVDIGIVGKNFSQKGD